MKLEIVENRILIQQDELDIYDAPDLKENIISTAKANAGTVILDLNKVESISTPIIQLLLTSRKSLTDFQVLNISNSVKDNLKLFGFTI